MSNLVISNKKSIKLDDSVLAYLIGLLVGQNVLYAIKISNTYINVIYIITAIIFIVKRLSSPIKFKQTIKGFDKLFFYYIIAIIISVIPYSYIVITNDNIRYQSYFSGLISLVLGLTLYTCVLYFADYRGKIFTGLWHGLIINVLVSLLQLIMFNRGSYFSFYDWFPQPAFYVSIKWNAAQSGILSNNLEYLIFYYRAIGLFLECSYLVGYVSSVILITILTTPKSIFRFIILTLLTFLIAISGSANLVIYFGVFIIYICVNLVVVGKVSKNDNRIHRNIRGNIVISKHWIKLLWFIATAILIIYIIGADWISSYFSIDDITSSVKNSFATTDITDSDNITRYTFMLKALDLVAQYPFGVGYNMASSVLKTLSGSYATFNYFITILLELGPIGIMAYILFIGNTIFILLKNYTSKYSIALAVSVLAICACQFGNGVGFFPSTWLVFALCNVEKSNIYENRRNINLL